jgi:hypothetical protein
MDTGQHDWAYYFAKASEYRMKAAAAEEEERQRALAVVALEFVQMARERMHAPGARSMH